MVGSAWQSMTCWMTFSSELPRRKASTSLHLSWFCARTVKSLVSHPALQAVMVSSCIRPTLTSDVVVIFYSSPLVDTSRLGHIRVWLGSKALPQQGETY